MHGVVRNNVLRIRIGSSAGPDPDQSFYLSPDRIRIRIQAFSSNESYKTFLKVRDQDQCIRVILLLDPNPEKSRINTDLYADLDP